VPVQRVDSPVAELELEPRIDERQPPLISPRDGICQGQLDGVRLRHHNALGRMQQGHHRPAFRRQHVRHKTSHLQQPDEPVSGNLQGRDELSQHETNGDARGEAGEHLARVAHTV
jgi:hypothetical protein